MFFNFLMSIPTLPSLLALGFLLIPVPFCPGADYQTIPTPPSEQMAIFKEMAAKTNFSVYKLDESRNIVFVGFCHGKHGRSAYPDEQQIDKKGQDLPGLTDADFAKILHFPQLRAVATQFQTITDDGYAVLRAFPELEAVNLSNLKTGFKDEASAGAPPTSAVFRHLEGARDLRYWNTTHSFGYQKEPAVLQELTGYPDLEYLNVDVGHANDFEELFPFIQKSPKLKFLKLHRTNFREEEVKMILDALPELERLDIKPSGNEPGERWSYQSLALIKNYPNLKSLRLIHGDALPLPWENGLEHLVEAENLKYFDFPMEADGKQVSSEALQRLQEARPELIILPLIEDRQERNAQRDAMEVDATEFNMEIGPT